MDRSTYKILTILLLVVVVILGILLYQEKNETIAENLEEPTMELQACNSAITTWRAENGTVVASASQEAQDELADILTDCQDALD